MTAPKELTMEELRDLDEYGLYADGRLRASIKALRDQLIATTRREQELLAIIKRVDEITPLADETCDEPDITLSEAIRRELEEYPNKYPGAATPGAGR